MAMTSKKALGNLLLEINADLVSDFAPTLTVSTMVKTMLEIIKIKKSHVMDKETKKQFPFIANEIILLAEQTK